MPRDYAKRSRDRRRSTARTKSTNRRKSSKRATANRGSTLRSYFTGLLSGIFISFLVYLGTLPADDTATVGGPAAQQPKPDQPEVTFEFYDQLKEQRVEVDTRTVEPAADVSKPRVASAPEVYLLQAGAFRQREDADSRRAELIFLGLEPSIQATSSDGKRWYRVQLGPFDTSAAMNKARALTAAQGIETLPLKRPRN